MNYTLLLVVIDNLSTYFRAFSLETNANYIMKFFSKVEQRNWDVITLDAISKMLIISLLLSWEFEIILRMTHSMLNGHDNTDIQGIYMP